MYDVVPLQGLLGVPMGRPLPQGVIAICPAPAGTAAQRTIGLG